MLSCGTSAGVVLDVAPGDDAGTPGAGFVAPLVFGLRTNCGLPFSLWTSAGSAGSGFLVTLSF